MQKTGQRGVRVAGAESGVTMVCRLLTLVGGAIYPAFLLWCKRVLPNRVIGNVLVVLDRELSELEQAALICTLRADFWQANGRSMPHQRSIWMTRLERNAIVPMGRFLASEWAKHDAPEIHSDDEVRASCCSPYGQISGKRTGEA